MPKKSPVSAENPVESVPHYDTGRQYLLDALNNPALKPSEKVKVAIALFRTEKRAAGRPGKKEEASMAALEMGTGKFATPDAPKPNGGKH